MNIFANGRQPASPPQDDIFTNLTQGYTVSVLITLHLYALKASTLNEKFTTDIAFNGFNIVM